MEFFYAHAAGSLQQSENFLVAELFVTDLSCYFFFFLRSHSPKEPKRSFRGEEDTVPIPPPHQSPYRVMLRCRFALPSISPYPL